MQRKLLVSAVAASLLALGTASAETTQCTEITAVPFQITAPGVYCLKGSVSGNGGVLIGADYVTLDLNGHTLAVTSGIGVAGFGSRNATVRNGTIRGGTFAVSLEGFQGTSGHLVEGIRAEGVGLRVYGDGSVVRNNVVIGANGGTTINYGIETGNGAGMRVSDNVIANPGAGFSGEVGGIRVINATGALIERNAITRAEPPVPGANYGILMMSSEGTTVAANRIVNAYFGIFSNTFGAALFVDNVVRGAAKPFGGGVMVGSTNVSY
jgi:hypothetical protein